MAQELDPISIPKTDAAGTLCAIISTVLRDPDRGKMNRTLSFLADLSELFFNNGYGQDTYTLLKQLIDNDDNWFHRIHVIYCAIEKSDISSADIFTLLARYNAGTDEHGRFGLRADGDAPPIWLLSAIHGPQEFNGK